MKIPNKTQTDNQNKFNVRRARCGAALKSAATSLLLCACILSAFQAQAQTVRFKSAVGRVTVPLGFSGSVSFTNLCTVSGLSSPVDLSISGLPGGVTYTIIATNGTALPVDGGLPSTTITTNTLITLTFDGTETTGLSTLSLSGSSGAVNNFLFNVQVGKIWSGADAAAGVSTNWSDSANWSGGSAPGATDDVIFGQAGATNAVITNIIVDANATVASVRFCPTNSTFKFHTMQINPGVTLTMNGTNGFGVMKDYPNVLTGLGGLSITLSGIGGTMVVSNEAANFIDLVDNNTASPLDMSLLGTFVADVSQVGIGDYSFWPNYGNLNNQNAYGGRPSQFLNSINLARTNIIKAVYADPFNSTNADARHFSISWLNTEISGSTTVQNFNFGISNMFYVDSINIGGGNSRGNAQFFSGFANSNPIAIFRGTNGGRMSVFAIADGAGTNSSQTSPNNNINFSVGTVDILADRFYIGRDRKLIPLGQNPSYVGNFFMGKGTVDANTVILGYREYNQTNATITGLDSFGYCVGRITVTNTAVFKVNGSITLGSTTATNTHQESSLGNSDQGNITIFGGGTVIANTILVGGPSYVCSRNNYLLITNGSLLIVSNTVAGTNQYLDNYVLANGSTNMLFIDGNRTAPYIYTTNVAFGGTVPPNVIQIGSIINVGSFPAQLPLIYHVNATSGNLPKIVVPPGISASLQDNGANNTIDVLLSTHTPNHLLWRGVTANWDFTSPNWLDQVTGLTTNFNNFDFVAFDDAGGHPTNILITQSVVPTAINMTNTLLRYQFNGGGGNISGSATLTKTGTGLLDVELSTSAAYAINQGSLIVGSSASASGVTLASGTALRSDGTINNGITCAGTATINSGTVNGSLDILNGGIFTNLAAVQNGSFTLESGSFVYNGVNATFDNFGSSSIATNATFNNDGLLGTFFGGFLQNLTVNGTLIDSGASGFPSMLLTTLTINSGGVFVPGGNGIGTSQIRNPLSFTNSSAGRVMLGSGSTTIFKVDAGAPANTLLESGYQDFGPSQSGQLQNGATLVITNVGVTAFAAGQNFRLFEHFDGANPISTGTSSNSFPVIVPASPGPGLTWDLSHLWRDIGNGTWGYVGVITTPVVHLTNSFEFPDGTNIISRFAWATNYYGYRLQSQVNPVVVGLSTNWGNVAAPSTNTPVSWATTSYSLTNKIISTNSVFYRLVYP